MHKAYIYELTLTGDYSGDIGMFKSTFGQIFDNIWTLRFILCHHRDLLVINVLNVNKFKENPHLEKKEVG